MMAECIKKIGAWSATAGLAIGLALVSGCYPEEEASTSAPPSPLPTSDISRPVQLPPDRADQGGETKGTSRVKRDLTRDLASPVVEPGGPTSTFPPPARPEGGTRAGKP